MRQESETLSSSHNIPNLPSYVLGGGFHNLPLYIIKNLLWGCMWFVLGQQRWTSITLSKSYWHLIF